LPAFAVPTSEFTLSFTQDNSVALLQRLVELAHSSNPSKRVKLSIGGWDGSKYFSQAVSNPTTTATFVNNIKNAVNTYGVDGIDIDWEYPGVQGAGSNIVSPSDTVNFLSFLQQLRSTLGSSALLTAAVSTSPFYIPSSNSTSATNIFNSFGQVLDYITVMNYDVHDNSGSSSPGSNAPLLSHGPSCPSGQDAASAELAIDQWTKAGFPVEKILLGVPSYGYAVTSTATTLTETLDRRRRRRSVSTSMRKHSSARRRLPRPRSQRRQGQEPSSSNANASAMLAALTPGPVMPDQQQQQNTPAVPSSSSNINLAAAASPPGSSDGSRVANVVTDDSGQVQFNYLVQVGALIENTTATTPTDTSQRGNSTSSSSPSYLAPPPSFVGSGSYTRFWDKCSSTPYLVSQSQRKVIPYDDPESLQLKARYAMQRGLAGVNMFDIHGDMLDWVLTDALRSGLRQPGPPITN
jgi:chitinase